MRIMRLCARSPSIGLHSLCREVWSETERQEFITFIASSPEAGSVIRWQRWLPEGAMVTHWHRKASGARVIYFLAQDGTVWLLSFTRSQVRQPANVIHRKAETGSPNAL